MVEVTNDLSLKVENLNSQVGGFRLKNISFELPVGEVLAILGPSGSGKTVLLRTLAGLNKTESGAIVFGDERIEKYSPRDRKVGFVFQNYAIFPHLDTKLNLGFPLYIGGKKKKEVYKIAIKEAEELDGLPNYLELKPDELPEGMKQLIAFGREKLHDCRLLLLDEPLSQLDRKLHVEMRALLKSFIKELGKTTIAVFSDPEDALSVSDYLAILDDGELLQFGETFDIYKNPSNLKVMELTSRLGLNTIDVEIKGGNVLNKLKVDKEDGSYKLCFRPEEITIKDEGFEVQAVESHIYDSSHNLVECDFHGKPIRLLVHKNAPEKFNFIPTNPKYFL
ncbi:ABC transporter related [Petrotoga mobilis SJ95]|jgi:multiple sugar transport system ATP-binding protein|uniref:ABC transporter related n=1 Tax=Petrotoga mobilis (strain DSM 10674 / SJ95) TaxID=403833 RepID=A9BJ92_PETMO|nr:ABC transporter ATP-binding protein [Petrotoga mobilis]ABX31037.1 ABC transporter related [Petrotoga mobilis SJ95]